MALRRVGVGCQVLEPREKEVSKDLLKSLLSMAENMNVLEVWGRAKRRAPKTLNGAMT